MPASPYTVVRARRERRRVRLDELGYLNYPAYLKSAHWQDTRRCFRESDQPQDCMCGETDGLHLHHMTYDRLGAERLSDLTPLCANCHALIHTLEQRGEIGLDFTGLVSEQRAKRYEGENARRYAEQAEDADRREAEVDLVHLPRRLVSKLVKLQREAEGHGVNINEPLTEAITKIRAQMLEGRAKNGGR